MSPDDDARTTDLTLAASGLRRPLGAALALVVGAGVAVELAKARYGLASDQGIVPLLSLSYEWNLPTVYTAALLFVDLLLLALSAAAARRRGARFVAHWGALAGGFGLMALDELMGFHERADQLVALNHVVHFDWIVPAALLVMAVGAAYVPFLRHLPPPTRWRFVAAGAIYVGGAVGMEVPLGWWTSRHGEHGLGYALIDAVEEGMEMLGLSLFLLALVEHLARQGVGLRFGGASTGRAEGAEVGR